MQAAIVRHLVTDGWELISNADTAARTPGKDIVARKGYDDLWISVKGWPEKSKNVQARHWFSGALFDLVVYRGESKSAQLAIGIPAGFSTYTNLIPRVSWLRQALPFDIYLVDESGRVTVIGSTHEV